MLVFLFDKSHIKPYFLFKMQIKACLMTESTKQQGAPQHFADAGQPEGLPANSPPQAKIFEEKTVTFPFLNTNINFNLNPRNVN